MSTAGRSSSVLRRTARTVLQDLEFARDLRSMPRRVALNQLRARLAARRLGDLFSLTSATRPTDLTTLLRLAHGRRHIVELGTGTAWTTIALATAEPNATVYSYDPAPQAYRDLYLQQAPRHIRSRIILINAPGRLGPSENRPVDLLYIDSEHTKANTLAEVAVWMPAMAPGGVVVFDDYKHGTHHGVAEAVHELGLTGERVGMMFIHRVPAGD